MLEAIFVANNEPSIIVSKYQIPPKTSELAERAVEHIRQSSKRDSCIAPFIYDSPHSFLLRRSGDIWIIAAVTGDSQAMFFASILEKVEELLKIYCGTPLTDFNVKDNFAMIYRVIDTFLDSSFPFADDYNGVMQFISQDGGERATLNHVAPWRANGPVFKKQQFLIDVKEFFDYIVSLNGKVEIAQIRGEIEVDAQINGAPRCAVVWKNSPLFDDVAFHRCVDYHVFMQSKRMELIPPQGKFILAKYRLQTQEKPPINAKVVCTPTRGKLDIKITIDPPEKQIDNLSVKFEIKGAKESTLQSKQGDILLGFESCTWKIGKLKPGKSAELSGAVGCSEECRQTTFCFDFETVGLMSNCELVGLQVDCSLDASVYAARYLTKAGRFQIRAGQQ